MKLKMFEKLSPARGLQLVDDGYASSGCKRRASRGLFSYTFEDTMKTADTRLSIVDKTTNIKGPIVGEQRVHK